MKQNNIKNKKWNAPLICFLTFFIVISILFIQFCYLALSKKVYGIDMKSFAANRNTVTNILTAKRGNIYDIEGNVLAQNISSYTLIAYLDPSRTVDDNYPEHVVDKEYTAIKLATILGEENKDYILERLNKNSKQVEFGTIGKNLTELTKIAIEELDLPGIAFSETVKRYYPNGDFASYIIGYAKQYTRINIKLGEEYDLYDYYKNFFDNYSSVTIENFNDKIVNVKNTNVKAIKKGSSILLIKSDGLTLANIVVNVTDYDILKPLDLTIVGELGIESNFEDKLVGVDGYVKYQQDKYGYKIPDTPEERIESKDGYDIYLTLDSNIQRFAESAVNNIEEFYNPKWTIISVMDAKDGSILASATSPSYNPNNLSSDMSYQNPLVSYSYEPGSVMKIYTYMCAIEKGGYNGDKTYLSGSYEFSNGDVVHDWDINGWGYLSYDQGFSYSSNVGIINIIKDYLSMDELKQCLEKYGFNNKTGIELSNEEKGNVSFKYETEIMSAGFGQGISTTPIQQLQALSIIANDGVMVKPHIIDKMVDINTKEEFKTKVDTSDRLVSTNTINKIKDLMESVIQKESPTGNRYYLEGYNIIGKTGTAQIYGKKGYLTGANDYIVSIALMYPKDDPEIIIYAASKQPEHDMSQTLPDNIKELIQNISKYKSMSNNEESNSSDNSYTLSSYINKDTDKVFSELSENKLNVIRIGDGNKVVKQYPEKNVELLYNDKVFLITNSTNYIMPNIINWSRLDVINFCNLIGLQYSFEGYGYVTSQSIIEGSSIDLKSILNITLERNVE
ncbi:MAG: penicillin-binding protein [bacterium]|nr:penicillin-binding protein [bacterium]